MAKGLNKRKCKECGEVFQKKQPLQMCCSITCSINYSKALEKKKKDREWKSEKKQIKEKLKTNADYVKELQVIFNRFIRERDKLKGCISCGTPLTSKYDAGHYFSAGGNPELRFNEDNCFGQCVYCNQHLHANLHEYTERLPKRIGEERFNQLKELRGTPKKYSIPELIELKVIYKDKIKELN